MFPCNVKHIDGLWASSLKSKFFWTQGVQNIYNSRKWLSLNLYFMDDLRTSKDLHCHHIRAFIVISIQIINCIFFSINFIAKDDLVKALIFNIA